MAEFSWQSPGDSEPKYLPQTDKTWLSIDILLSLILMALTQHSFAANKALTYILTIVTTSLGFRLLLKIKQMLKWSSLKGILGGGKCRDHGLLKPNIHGAEQSTNLLSETRIWLPHSAYRTPNTCRHWSMNYRLKTNKMIQLWIFSLSCI